MTSVMSLSEKYPETLAALVPDTSRFEKYVSRSFGEIPDLDLLAYAGTSHANVLIEGEAGAGKTHLVEAHAAKQGYAFINVPCNGSIDPDALFGQPFRKDDGTIGFRYGSIVLAALYGKSVIYLDEVNMMRPNVAAVLHGTLDHRRTLTLMQHGESQEGSLQIPLHPTTQVIGTRNVDYRGTSPMNEAFRDRFLITLPFGYDPDVERYLIGSPTLQKVAALLRESVNSGDLYTPVSTRKLIAFETFVADLSYPFAVANFVGSFEAEEAPIVQGVLDTHEDKLLADYGYQWVEAEDTASAASVKNIGMAQSAKATGKGPKKVGK